MFFKSAILDLGFDILDRINHLNLQSNGFPLVELYENLWRIRIEGSDREKNDE